MKIVGFSELGKKSKKKKAKIFCITNFFKNSMIVLSVLIVLMVFGMVNSSFTSIFKDCINNFVSSISKILII